LRKWTNNDKSATNGDALPEFVDFANEVGKHAIERDKMLRFAKYNFDKKLKAGDLAITPKKNDQLIKFFRKQFDDNIRAFRFPLNDHELFTTFPIHSFILFAIQIRSVFATLNQLPRVELLYSLAQIFTGFLPHREEKDSDKEHAAGKLPHNNIFSELVVVACGSMIGTFCQLGYLNASKHKTGAMEILVNADYMDLDELMIIPTQDVLEERIRPGSATIHPDLGVTENKKPLPLLQTKMQPLSKRTSSNTKPPPTIGLTKKEYTLRSERLKKRICYCEKDDQDEEGEVDNEEKWKRNHTVIDSCNSRQTIGVTNLNPTSNRGVRKDGKPIINTAIKTRMRTIKTRMTTPKKTMKATGKITSEASNLIKVNGHADTRMIHSGPITDGIIWKNGNLRTRRNGQRPPHAWIISNAKI
jgi:hypothetical protein